MWLLPSLNRVPSLIKCLSSINTVGCSTPGIIILGANQQNEISRIKPLPANWRIELQNEQDRSLVDVMNRFVREHPDLPWYGYLQDDLEFKTREWDIKLIKSAGHRCIASSNDLWRAPKRNAGASAFGGDLIRAWGFWGPPKLQHCYIDDFWEDSGEKCKNWKVLMDVHILHYHFANPKNKAVKDATYQFSYAPDKQDRQEWFAFKSSPAYSALLDRVRSLA
jgi:hypothetical protein